MLCAHVRRYGRQAGREAEYRYTGPDPKPPYLLISGHEVPGGV
jgi:hypothetical protein